MSQAQSLPCLEYATPTNSPSTTLSIEEQHAQAILVEDEKMEWNIENSPPVPILAACTFRPQAPPLMEHPFMIPFNAKPEDKQMWHATFTDVDGLQPEFIQTVCTWMRYQEFSLVKYEVGKNGNNPHLHCIFTIHGSQGSSNVRKKVRCRFYVRGELKDPHQLKVQKVTDLPGLLVYLNKDDGKVLLTRGFKESWIQEQIEAHFNKRKLFKTWQYIRTDQAPHAIIAFCDMKNLSHPSEKTEFAAVLAMMTAQGINIRGWLKDMPWIYSQVQVESGRTGIMTDLVLNALRFIG